MTRVFFLHLVMCLLSLSVFGSAVAAPNSGESPRYPISSQDDDDDPITEDRPISECCGAGVPVEETDDVEDTNPSDPEPPSEPYYPPVAPNPSAPPEGSPPSVGQGKLPHHRRRRAASAVGDGGWIGWYINNRRGVENLKRSLYTRVTHRNPLFQMGGSDTSNRSDATHAMDRLGRAEIIKALFWAADPSHISNPAIRGSAYVAAGKIASRPEHIAMLKRGLMTFENKQVNQSAAVALGLLRRSSPSRQFAAAELARVRELLFDVFKNKSKYDTRTRSLAILSIGMLGDQRFSK